MRVVLISTYELGHQPFSLASAAAWLRKREHQVACVDLSITCFQARFVEDADLVAISLPMHTATRLAVSVIREIRELRPDVSICCFGLYAPLNAEYLRRLGVSAILGGEFEAGLADVADGISRVPPLVSLVRLQFETPDRRGLPSLARYPKLLEEGRQKLVGYTEASRGCKHLCRHCPIVPVYNGAFRVVQAGVVLEDVRAQVAAGAEHITFGDPDFFNGPTHAARIVEALHREFPGLTYDATIKVEHLLKHRDLLPVLKETGCSFVTTAVESVEDAVLEKLDKGHTRQDFIDAVDLARAAGLPLTPTFVPFTPWTTRVGYCDLLSTLVRLDVVDAVNPVQLALRLLIPAGSRLLELDDVRAMVSEFDAAALLYRWKHSDPAMDELAAAVLKLVHRASKMRLPRRHIFQMIWELAHGRAMEEPFDLMPRATIPYLNEPWYC